MKKPILLLMCCCVFLFGSMAWAESSPKVQPQSDVPVNVQEGICSGDISPEMLAKSGCCSWHNGVCGCQNGRLVCCDGSYSPTCRCQSEEVEIPN